MSTNRDHVWPGFSTVAGMLGAKNNVKCLTRCEDCRMSWSEMALLGRGREKVAMVAVEGGTPCETKHAYICDACLKARRGDTSSAAEAVPAPELPDIDTFSDAERTATFLAHRSVFEEIRPEAEEYATHADFFAARAEWLQRYLDTLPRSKK